MGAGALGAKWLISEKLPKWQRPLIRELRRRCPRDKNLVWILSSGTQSVNQVKAIALTRAAIEISARAVNAHLRARRSDRWLMALPASHIGGYAIEVRARLVGAQTFRLKKWSVQDFTFAIERHRITLTSLVPTQVHDLVRAGLFAPKTLRAVVVGGGALEPELYRQARGLGWPLLPSYGLTECASQVATAPLDSLKTSDFPDLQILKHVQMRTDEGRVSLRSKAICVFVATMNSEGQFTLEVPTHSGWLRTSDLGEIRGAHFHPQGRGDETLKISGVLVSLLQVEHELRALTRDLPGNLAVISWPHPRLGAELMAVTDTPASLKEWERRLREYNRQARGPWRVPALCWVPQLPVTELGKIKRAELRAYLRLA